MSDQTKHYDLDDDRLASYLDTVTEGIGFALSHNASSAGNSYRSALARDADTKTKPVDMVYRDWAGMGGNAEIEIYAYESPQGDGTKYIAEWITRIAFDDYRVRNLMFHRQPSQSDIKVAEFADQVARRTRRGELDPTFTCWKCGIEVHVLDAASGSGDQVQKLRTILDAAERRYCYSC